MKMPGYVCYGYGICIVICDFIQTPGLSIYDFVGMFLIGIGSIILGWENE